MRPIIHTFENTTEQPPGDELALGPFSRKSEPIEFLDLLSTHPTSYSPEDDGGQGHVFKVSIGPQDRLFALKVFKFFNLERAREDMFPEDNKAVPDDTMIAHSDPFFAECRAYAKLQNIQEELLKKGVRPAKDDSAAKTRSRSKAPRQRPKGSKTSSSKRNQPPSRGVPAALAPARAKTRVSSIDDIAVLSYGHVFLPREFERLSRKQFDVTDWCQDARPNKEFPFRAIVKELVETDVSITNPQKMLKALLILRKHDLFARDIAARNYLNGRLIDFGMAWTKPHWAFAVLDSDRVARRIRWELSMFDKMIKTEGIKTKVRALKQEVPPSTRELRPRQ